MLSVVITILAWGLGATAHTAAFTHGMFCEGGANASTYDQNTNTAVVPLYQLPKTSWWMQADRGCNKALPRNGASMALPAGGEVVVELAHNQGQTTLSFDGRFTSDWPDGKTHPENWAGPGSPPDCIQDDGAMHTYNETTAAGTAFAISYQSDLSKVTMENLVVFSVLQNTPWKRIAKYQVPRDLPACPPDGCYCAWLWVPSGCGTPNMYMQNLKCHVTGTTSVKQLAAAKPPVFCQNASSKCVKGAKQMIAWNQADGNNVQVPNGASPGYNIGMGFASGAQNDIFQ